jgi:hypothetical protein
MDSEKSDQDKQPRQFGHYRLLRGILHPRRRAMFIAIATD